MGINLSDPNKIIASFDSPQEIIVNQADDSILIYGRTTGDVNKPVQVDANGVVKVDGSGFTQPVSGTVTANQGTSPWVVSGSITTSPNVNIHDGSGNSLTSQVNGSQRALDVGIDVAGIQVDPRSIRALTSADTVTVVQPTGTNLHAVLDSGTLTTITNVVHVDDNSGSLTVDGTVAATQSGTWNINNISGTISLPTGAATSANQTTEITALGTINTTLGSPFQAGGSIGNTSFIATQSTGTNLHTVVDSGTITTITNVVHVDDNSGSLTVDGTVAATQSGLWTVTANAGTNLNTSALALESGGNLASIKSDVDNLALSQGTSTSGQKGNLVLTATTSSAPTYTTATSNPFSTTTAGALRTDSSATTQPISAASLPLPSGAATSANQSTEITALGTINTTLGSPFQAGGSIGNTSFTATQATGTNLHTVVDSGTITTITNVVHVDDNSGSLTVDGTVAATQSGTWNINNVSGTISLPTGASTSALQTTGNTSLSSIDTKIPSNLTVTSTRLLVDPSGVTSPISAASLPLPSGASTSANQTTEITALQLIDDIPSAMNAAFSKGAPAMGQLDDTSTTAATEDNVAPVRITAQRAFHVNLRNNSGTEIATSGNPLRIDPTGSTTQPVSGTVTATIAAPSSSSVTSVSSSATNVTLLSSNAARLGASIYNDSNKILYVKLGTTASTSSYTLQMSPNSFYEIPYPVYTGRIDGIWASANGAARITELS